MADSLYSLAKLVTINNENLSGGVAEELLEDAPLVAAMAAQPASNGTDHHWLRYDTADDTVGFRALNDGLDHGSTSDTAVTINLKILDASFTCDVQTARGYPYGVDAFLDREGMRHLKTAFAELERQVINGTGNNAAGFDGMYDQTELSSLASAKTIAGGGTTALTSVLVMNTKDPMVDAAVITGNDGNIQIDPPQLQRVAGGTTGWMGGYFVNIASWYGYQHGSTHSVVRICNLDAGSNSLSDALISQAIAEFPAGRRSPNLIAMNRRSLQQLQSSRTATNTTGFPAPFPQEAFGIPIVVTDQIGLDETAVV